MRQNFPSIIFSKHLVMEKIKINENSCGFVLDVDGVLIKDGNLIEGTLKGLDLLDEKKIPYIFLTNGGKIYFIQ
jgi:ribonucleotide monophosphatase NagD (HAD superfamily)